MSGSNTEKQWFDFVDPYISKLNESNQDWNQLESKEQEIVALSKLEMDMYNGGFIQFFCNWGYTCYLHAIRCLEKLSATNALMIIQKQYALIEPLENDDRIKELWDIPKYLPQVDLKTIAQIDEEYWEDLDNIMEISLTYYTTN